MIEKILLATDGSEASARGSDFAASLALKYDAQVMVVHAIPPSLPGRGESEEHSISLVRAVADQLRQIGIKQVDEVSSTGTPVNIILNLAHNYKPDIIIIGARGLGAWSGLILGSVSMAVAQRAECAVLVVK